MKQKDPTVNDVACTQKLLRSAIVHCLRLFNLKQILSKKKKKYGGVKFHSLWYHWGLLVIILTAAYFCDLALFEHAHIKDGIQTFDKTSKRKFSQTSEMMGTIVNRSNINRIKSLRHNRVVRPVDDDVDADCMQVYAGGIIAGIIIVMANALPPNVPRMTLRSAPNHHSLLEMDELQRQIYTYVSRARWQRGDEVFECFQNCIHANPVYDCSYEMKVESTVTITPPKSSGIAKYTIAACKNYYKKRIQSHDGNRSY